MATPAKSATVTLAPQHQNVEAINRIVATVLGRSGCPHCGRLINLAFQFQGDPEPDLAKQGVVSIHTEGF
jgi:hypothetical protein